MGSCRRVNRSREPPPHSSPHQSTLGIEDRVLFLFLFPLVTEFLSCFGLELLESSDLPVLYCPAVRLMYV